jgi:type I restriction enzyme S subunit
VGKAALIKNVGEPLVYESMNIRLRLANKNQLAPYISKILLERRARFYFYSIAKVANGQVSINQTQLYELLIPLPPLAEQHRIVQKLDELMQYCNELETSIKQSESQNKQLLQQVLREALRK